MRKIPTVFKRDPENMKHVLTEVNPDCEWVLAGEGTATRKYDGTCILKDNLGEWWARREVKAGRTSPAGFSEVSTDPNTGKTVGWVPIETSSFHKWFCDALEHNPGPYDAGTYELCGPKVQGNPENFEHHLLVPHGAHTILLGEPVTFERIRDAVLSFASAGGWEGIVWHHPDGRMAKIKARDFSPPGDDVLATADSGSEATA